MSKLTLRFWWILPIWMLVLNLIGVCIMGTDKRRAKRGAWRVPEKTIFLVALLGGATGVLAGMWIFHHKTRRWYFKYGMPALLVLQIAALVWIGANQ